jgi:hypothetical protein
VALGGGRIHFAGKPDGLRLDTRDLAADWRKRFQAGGASVSTRDELLAVDPKKVRHLLVRHEHTAAFAAQHPPRPTATARLCSASPPPQRCAARRASS